MSTMPRLAYPAPIKNADVPPFPRPRLAYPLRTFEVARHPESPLGDRRERAAVCASCRRETWNICGACNTHCDHSPSTSSTSA
jgi:hypothetical protein